MAMDRADHCACLSEPSWPNYSDQKPDLDLDLTQDICTSCSLERVTPNKKGHC